MINGVIMVLLMWWLMVSMVTRLGEDSFFRKHFHPKVYQTNNRKSIL